MLFNSLDYMLFLLSVIFLYWFLLKKNLVRLTMLFVASCIFYMAWRPYYIVLILSSTVLDFIAGNKIASATNPRVKKAWLLLSLCGNLGLLGTFKYFNFFSQAVTDIASLFGAEWTAPYLNVLLPVGISFYTFQTLSYTIDIYRGTLKPTKSFIEFACFVTYFPQLVAGPIVRASELLPQLAKKPSLTKENASQGMFLIALGLIKKVAFADYLSVNLVDRVFSNPEAYTSPEVILGLYAFTVQMYCDFSGYTDVARGSAKLMGLELPENFDRPYQATNPADFWRRWHMTLSRWLRDYLYFPLGGSKCSPARAYFNLWITLFLIGLWHGASWTFVWYGSLQATVMVIHRFIHRRFRKESASKSSFTMRLFKIFACLQFVVFSRILFRATDMDNAWAVTKQIFTSETSMAQLSTGVWAVLLIGFFAHYFPKSWIQKTEKMFIQMPAIAKGVCLTAVAVALHYVAVSEVVPYIYFQF